MQTISEQVRAGQAVYTQSVLRLYDLWVLGVSNAFIWKCPTQRLMAHYHTHVSANHLEVGVGTGYFPDHCRFPVPTPRVALMDLNVNTLGYAARRIARYQPETYRQNVLQPIAQEIKPFDSIAVNYLLHCLPGAMEEKGVLFGHLAEVACPGAVVFGSTLLHGGVERSGPARHLMNLYNRKGIFSNRQDNLQGLVTVLEQYLTDINIEVIGCAALFSARVT